MTHTNESNDPDRIDPEQTNESHANDRFMHGMLGHIHHDTKEENERRIQQLLTQLDQSDAPSHHRERHTLRRLIPLASAAMIMMIAITLFILTPQSSAYAIVNNAIEATRSSTALRYEIRDSDDDSGLIGTLDMRGSLSRIEIKAPRGHSFIMGTDDQGDWSMRRDGTVERLDPRGAAPRWLNLGESTILIASLDEFLIQLKNNYSVTIISGSPSSTIQLSATRLATVREPGPDRIVAWVDQDTQLVQRLELSWDPRHPPKGQSRNRPPPNFPSNPPPNPPPPHGSPDDPDTDIWFPEFLGPKPLFDEGRDPPPPPLIIFQRVDWVEMSEDYFSPPAP